MGFSSSQSESACSNGRGSGARSFSARSSPQLRLEDLIARPTLEVDQEGLRDCLADRTVLLTGAGGSIGTELACRLHALQPARLVLVDVSEHNLFALERHFDGAARADRLSFHLADVRNRQAMETIFSTHRPDVVLHAAAYKHVPLMERHPAAAFRNNTMATVRLLQQCDEHEVEQFVFVSTDKAVEPISVLGTTKQLAEWYVRSVDMEVTGKIVRFGNVFGSRGSVVPRFTQQLANGGPLQVTHPDMERYFMSAEEAGNLLLQTLLLEAAPIYALKMGEPVRIQWLAEEILHRLAPERDPEACIEYTGRRPGEKLRERLRAPSEELHPTSYPHIFGFTGTAPYSRSELESHFESLQEDPQQLRAAPDTLSI